MILHGETIDLICQVKASNHVAMANKQGPVQVYQLRNDRFDIVAVLDEDHSRLITGICEITKVQTTH